MKPDRMLDVAQLTFTVSKRCADISWVRFAGKEPEVPCPIEQLHDIAYSPWTEPQPPEPPCPNCLMWTPPGVTSKELAVSVTQTRGRCLKSLDLYLDRINHHWDFKDHEICEGSTVAISGLSPGQKVTSAKIVMTEFSFEKKPGKATVKILD
jgi:hypothetical protein